MLQNLITEINEKIIPYSFLGAVGGIALQLNLLRKGASFKLGLAFLNVLLSAWIGYVCGSLIPESFGDIKFSIISISGFLSFPILDFIESKGLSLFLKKILGVEK